MSKMKQMEIIFGLKLRYIMTFIWLCSRSLHTINEKALFCEEWPKKRGYMYIYCEKRIFVWSYMNWLPNIIKGHCTNVYHRHCEWSMGNIISRGKKTISDEDYIDYMDIAMTLTQKHGHWAPFTSWWNMSQIWPREENICSQQEISDGQIDFRMDNQTEGQIDRLFTVGRPQGRSLTRYLWVNVQW